MSRVLITGTSSGIGKAIALKFIDEGWQVFGFDIKPATINHPLFSSYTVDVRDVDSFPDLPEVDVIINNAGVQNEDDINVNVIGAYNITEKYAFHSGIKSVLMIGSASGHTGAEFPLYSISKGGMLTYAKNVAIRLARYGATCNSLDLGGVNTELNDPVMFNPSMWQEIMEVTPLHKWTEVEEAAEWAYFLTVANKSCSGQNILVDNGEGTLNQHFVFPGYSN